MPTDDNFKANHLSDAGYEQQIDNPEFEKILNQMQLRIHALQHELSQAHQDTRAITETRQASNDVLQNANKGLLISSEVLQNLNDVLEISKKEIQTRNEDLTILNQALSDRNEELNLSNLFAESIVKTIREPFIVLNKNLVVKNANQPFYNTFQITEANAVGKHLYELGNKQWNIPGLRRMLEKILPEKSSIVDFEVVHDFPLLGERTLLLNASRISRESTAEQLILLAIEDITAQRKLDSESRLFTGELEKQVSERTFSLHEANTHLQHSNENLQQFAYIASHDLQEPLRKIRTFSSMLQERFWDELSSPAKELVTKIVSSSARMSTLIREVLNFSQILHGGVVFETTDLHEIMTQILNDFDLLITEKNAVIRCETLPVIEAIPLQIRQLFYNLISNSLKFARENVPLEITIKVESLTSEAMQQYPELNQKLPYCVISFKDNGIGFDQQYADRIFLIFHRLNSQAAFSGTGIGLALCKKIVVNHQGDIFAFSKENEGALFEILLPIKQDA